MSTQFSNTTGEDGLIQLIEDELTFPRGYISDSSARLKTYTKRINLALDDYFSLALPASGEWQYDDSGHSKYPTIKTNLVAGQRDYVFTTDEQGNLILDIYKVMVLPSSTATLYEEIYPIDSQSSGYDPISEENTGRGVPLVYDKQANGIFLEPIPSYSVAEGLKIYINREPSYFSTGDTTKMPGIPGLHHEYLVFKAALATARQKGHANYEKLVNEVFKYEGDKTRGITGKIQEYFAGRSRDKRNIMTGKKIKYI